MGKKSVFARLYLGQVLLAGAYALTFSGLYWSVSNQELAAKRGLALANYSQKVHAAALSCREMLRLSRTRDVAQAEKVRREASLRLAQSRAAARDEVSPEESAELDKLSRFVHASGKLLDKIVKLKKQKREREAAALYDTGLRPVIEQYVAAGVENRLQAEEADRLVVESRARLWGQLSLAAAALFAGLTLLISWLWTRRLVLYASGSVGHIQKAVSAIRAGHFQINLEPERADELGALCTSLKGLAARLEQAQGRLDDATEMTGQVSRALNEIVFAAGEFVALARQKKTLDAQDELGLAAMMDRVGKLNLQVGRLCELVAGQKLLAEDAPHIREALDHISASLKRQAPEPESSNRPS